MRSYLVFPTFDVMDPSDVRVPRYIVLATQLVCDLLRAGGDTFHTTIDWRDPGKEAWSICTEGLAIPHCISLTTLAELAEVVRFSVDPHTGRSASVIRSAATCRAVTFGYDGQAFLCLRHEDDAPISPDPELIVIEERPDLLTGTDYFDGVIVTPTQGSLVPGAGIGLPPRSP